MSVVQNLVCCSSMIFVDLGGQEKFRRANEKGGKRGNDRNTTVLDALTMTRRRLTGNLERKVQLVLQHAPDMRHTPLAAIVCWP